MKLTSSAEAGLSPAPPATCDSAARLSPLHCSISSSDWKKELLAPMAHPRVARTKASIRGRRMILARRLAPR